MRIALRDVYSCRVGPKDAQMRDSGKAFRPTKAGLRQKLHLPTSIREIPCGGVRARAQGQRGGRARKKLPYRGTSVTMSFSHSL